MTLKLMYITNEENTARIAEESGVDWIFIDLEILGKEERQGHLDTVISKHTINDVHSIKQVLTHAKLLVRVNPINENSPSEIDAVIDAGADIVMLPFFKKKYEVQKFVELVNGRAKVCLLCETVEAVRNIDEILMINGIDYIHIGLNDLHLGYGMKFMFEPLTTGIVDNLVAKFKSYGIEYGFGGIATLGKGDLPAEKIIAEHYRLGSGMVILSRSFTNNVAEKDLQDHFQNNVQSIRNYEVFLQERTSAYFIENQSNVQNIVEELVAVAKN